MATLNYTQRLANLQKRRFDNNLNESIISKSFNRADIPEDLKYLAESMKPITKDSTNRTIEAANRVQKHLEKGFNLNFSRAYRTQGSIMSNTHIKVSDFDFLTIIDGYYYTEPGIPILSPYQGVPTDDITELRKQSLSILKDIYDEVDNSNEKCISIFNKALNRKVDIVFAFWYNTVRFNETNDEYYRGVKFKTSQIQADYPFAHIKLVNDKGDNTLDGSRKAIRLLKSLKEDCDTSLKNIKSFHLTTIVHSIENTLLNFTPGNEIKIAQALSTKIADILDNPQYRKSIKSPNGIETPLIEDDLIPDIKILKQDLDILIEDSAKDLFRSDFLQKAILTY